MLNNVPQFIENAQANGIEIIQSLNEPESSLHLLSNRLTKRPQNLAIRAAPELKNSLANLSNNCSFGSTSGEHSICISKAIAGIADTGTLVLASSATSPTLLNFLSEHHVVILESKLIMSNKSEFWRWLSAHEKALPRALNFISGPSRTADIEQTIQIGAHGPRHLTLIIEDQSFT